MEFVPGSLAARLAAGHPLPAEDALKHIRSLLEALAACHGVNLAHRDIKPENIGFAADDTLKLLDLGLVTGADRTDATRVGTPLYMPPVPTTTAQDDLYAAGKVLYVILTGKKPPAELPALTQAERGAGTLSHRLHQAARKAAAPNPADRFTSASEFLAAILSDSPRKKPPGAACNPSNGSSRTTTQTQIMNTTQQSLTEAATVLGGIGQVQRQQALLQEAAKLDRPKYKVAVIGQGKAGKTTLIMRVFLKEAVLFVDTKEATAVPTEIEQGSPARLEVYPRASVTRTIEVDGKQVQVDIPAEGLPEVVEPLSPAAIKARTSSDTPQGRAALATRTSRARLQWPAPGLGDYTIVDTPGINSLTEAVVDTTYRVIPDADAVIFVLRDETQLHQIEESFLRGRVFDKGVSRCLVVLKTHKQGAIREHLVSAIRVQLDEMGREYVPVETIALPLPSETGEFAPLTAEEAASLATFERTLQEFLVQNVALGRQERASHVLTREIKQGRMECQVELSTLQKSDEEKAELESRISTAAHDFQRKYRRLGREFLRDLQAVQLDHYNALAAGLDKLGKEFANGFDGCNGLKEMQTRLRDADAFMGPRMDRLRFEVSDQTRAKITELEARYSSALQHEAAPWLQAVNKEFAVDGGFLVNLPDAILFIVDNVLVNDLAWGGWFIALVIQLVLKRLPGIEKLLPSQWLKDFALSSVKDGITDAIADAKLGIRDKLNAAFSDAELAVNDAWEANGQAQLDIILKPMRHALKESKNPAREAKLQSAIAALDVILAKAG